MQAEVIGGVFANRPITAVAVGTAPHEQIDVEITLAKDSVCFDLTMVASPYFRPDAVHVGTLFGDDIHHTSKSHVTVKRRGRTAQHLYLLHLLQGDAEVGGCRIGGIAVQTMPVEHDEYLFLSMAVDAAHSDVDVVITIDDVHTRHIGSQHFL